MLRLTLLLCFGMVAALFTLGQDRGQLRPGLAKAEAEGRLDEVWAEARAEDQPAAPPAAAPEPALVAVAPVPEPVAEPAPAPAALASAGPVVEVEAGRTQLNAVEEPVFSLSNFGNEAVPGEDGAPLEPAVDADVQAASTAPDGAPAGGTIWYVTADSVNVRSGPSTDAEVLGRLGNGEAALLVAAVDSDWARIVIQGDGVEGYVAMRFLSPTFP